MKGSAAAACEALLAALAFQTAPLFLGSRKEQFPGVEEVVAVEKRRTPKPVVLDWRRWGREELPAALSSFACLEN